MINSVLKVSCTGNSAFGTCFAISNSDNSTLFITCGHVINDCNSGDLLVDSHPATVVNNLYDEGLDLALLKVEGLQVTPLGFCEADESQGHEVIGFTNLGKDIKKEKIDKIRIKDKVEILKQPANLKVDSIKIYTDETISYGYSGSPIINSSNQRVVGIVSLKGGNSTNFGIANNHINNLHSIDISLTEMKTRRGLSTDLSSEASYHIKQVLESEFQECLTYFSSHNPVWNEPKLHSFCESDAKDNNKGASLEVSSIIASPRSMIINAHQQHGLSSLAKYMVKRAWELEEKSFWLYLDINELKPHTNDVLKFIKRKLKKFDLKFEDIACIVVDEVSTSVNEVQKILTVINDIFINLPIIIMMSKVDNALFSEDIDFDKIRHFEHQHLWSLNRSEIRNIVTCYNRDKKYIDEDEPVIAKLTSDLEVLNIPRTPLNCLTFLKIYEYDFDETPINRTDMISKVLYLLFNVDHIPKYKTRPDLKDVEFVLGYLCENFIREHKFDFSREYFLEQIGEFCDDSDIDMETGVIFDVLYVNGIIIQRNDRFCFKFSYWVLYFAAHRMHQNDDFADYVLMDMNYTSYPEIIEYYAGIRRNSSKVLRVLYDDVHRTRKCVEAKCKLPEDFDIYSELMWTPTDESLDSVKDMLEAGAAGSRLPDEIKDHYADQSYDASKPMKQSMHKILEEYSLLRLMRGIHSASKALRNSDYADSKLRHQLMSEIVISWELIIKFQVLLSPIICREKQVIVEGAQFQLRDCFSDDSTQALMELIPVIPCNVINWFKDDIFSKKMGSFFYKNAKKHDRPLALHTLALLVVAKRPIEWEIFIDEYIRSLNKNSYYLSSICQELQEQYSYSFTSAKELKNIEKLIKLSVAKHEGVKKLNDKSLKKVSRVKRPQGITAPIRR
ncbi:conserved hypothetical protein [Vibrio chagasii]|nr:conserved hypothetical protein [Vibrio chagasii]CAH6906619.1 conserved hypothetical protein [Vibrio chagasii]CAH6912945.1 conserved hypothetical protein [Vibrio chagasii]CAH6962911.1 conserved hypothetical protein [Vibrio chagasii]CAH7152497.1 conserved hypothetical protein [Vibrio chagasii]